MQQISGNIVDVVNREIFHGEILLSSERIVSITRDGKPVDDGTTIVPATVNAHVHIESTKMEPLAAGMALSEAGVLAAISDPHEIANVCGEAGLNWMLDRATLSPIQIMFGVPSCVPATSLDFETSGATLPASVVTRLLESGRYGYLAEVMNWPGVINGDPGLLEMIAKAHQLNLPVDGHAPEVRGKNLIAYANRGIQTNHECSTLDEALENIMLGMKVLIREGSAAKDFEALIDLIRTHPELVMFCTDDSEPHELKNSQPLALVKRAMKLGYDPISLFRAASLNPIKHYGLDVGLLQEGDYADFVVTNSLSDLSVQDVYHRGNLIVQSGVSTHASKEGVPINNFAATQITKEDLVVPASNGTHTVRVIDVIPGKIITKASEEKLISVNGQLQANPDKDILKLVVLNRYQPDQKPVVVFARNFGIKNGAIAGTIAHDSHNIVAVGSDDQSIAEAINLLVQSKGGVSLVGPQGASVVALPVAGLMSNKSPREVSYMFDSIEEKSKQLGTTLPSAFMALSFLALLVIPELKVSDKIGLFDAREFKPVSLFV